LYVEGLRCQIYQLVMLECTSAKAKSQWRTQSSGLNFGFISLIEFRVLNTEHRSRRLLRILIVFGEWSHSSDPKRIREICRVGFPQSGRSKMQGTSSNVRIEKIHRRRLQEITIREL
jgi:hypothetical protein